MQKMTSRLFFTFLFIHLTIGHKILSKPPVKAPAKPSQWKTLNGQMPAVVARGGYMGLFPDCSKPAIAFAIDNSLDDVTIYCSLQISKDGRGYCLSSLTLENATNVPILYPNGAKTHIVNGKQVKGHFVMDYTSRQLASASMRQGVLSRPESFDSLMLNFSTVEDVIDMKPPKFWLNIQNYNFYIQNKLDPGKNIQNLLKSTGINYISSPEIGFLKSMGAKVIKAKTKLVFVFLESKNVEPTTKKMYGELLKDLPSIKIFASAILVPKEHIWPVNKYSYLEKPTTLVQDAHEQGLEVYAYDFANDQVASHNYSYDPTNEYLQFIDNSQFSVDGFLTDFPSTASESIACLAHGKKATRTGAGKALVITHNGASGVYPGGTDLAYQQAVADGADIIDCTVQMSKDGVAFCLNTTDITDSSDAKSKFCGRPTSIPEIQGGKGIFTFDLSWREIQTLTPMISSPYSPDKNLSFGKYGSDFIFGSYGTDMLVRNPSGNKGKFVTLVQFLDFAKQKKVGVMIDIKSRNAAYLASKKGVRLTDVVASALRNASLDKPSALKVLIQSDDTSILSLFNKNTAYKRVLHLKEPNKKPAVAEIKKYANAVNLNRKLVMTSKDFLTSGSTGIVQELHKANISIYVSVFRNEFVTIPFDLFSDPYVELATYIKGLGIDGVITEYPATATAYMRSPCSDPKAELQYTILPVKPGELANSKHKGEEGNL